MGTTCFLISKHEKTAEVIRRHVCQTWRQGEAHGFDFEYFTMKGATGYAVMHREDKDTREKIHFGIVFKTGRHRTRHSGMIEFCIKEIDETMGPVQSQAPAKMLDLLDKLAPNPSGYAADWRTRCRENLKHARKKTKRAAGQRVTYGGTEYTLIEPAGPRKGWRVSAPNGAIYRMKARQLSQATAAPEPAPEPAPSKQISAAEFFADHFQIVHIGD